MYVTVDGVPVIVAFPTVFSPTLPDARAGADWLYELPEWDELLTPERRKELYREQKKSGTIVKERKVGRNEPCPCGSGKKYKYCCGRAK